MANGSNAFDFSITLADFLATVVGDGTNASIVQALKTDKAGFAVPASGISVASGQLWSNRVDDFILKIYELNPGRKDHALTTVGALTASVVLATLTTNGDVWRIGGVATGRTATAGEVASARFEGHFYRAAGVVSLLDPVHTVVTTAPLAGVDIDLDISGNDVRILATGIGGKTVTWTIRVDEAVEIS
jgi:hypothetical protein